MRPSSAGARRRWSAKSGARRPDSAESRAFAPSGRQCFTGRHCAVQRLRRRGKRVSAVAGAGRGPKRVSMYEADDPRSRLATAGSGAGPASAFGASTYARFYEEAPREQDSTQRTWYVRGQNFVVAWTEARDGAVLERAAQPDEYVLLLPEAGVSALVAAGDDSTWVEGYSVTMVPPGRSRIALSGEGPVI